MKTYLFLLMVVALLAAPVTVLGSAPKNDTLMLYEKNPSTWDIVPDGAYGEMLYGTERPTFCFSLCAWGLQPNQDYTLIYYPDPKPQDPQWPPSGVICLGEATSDQHGRLQLQVQYTDDLNIGDLPKEYDDNYPTGAKIWLVLSSDVDCGNQTMTAWNPTEYLFENNLITYDDTEDRVTFSPDSPSEISGAAGLLKFNPDEDTFDFTFCGSGLKPLQEYTLGIRNPASARMCLGSRKAFKNGNITIRGSVDTGDLVDAEIILVLSDDVDCGPPPVMLDWNPNEYLFGDALFSFNDTDSP